MDTFHVPTYNLNVMPQDGNISVRIVKMPLMSDKYCQTQKTKINRKILCDCSVFENCKYKDIYIRICYTEVRFVEIVDSKTRDINIFLLEKYFI